MYEGQNHLLLHPVRQRVPQVAGPVPCLRGVEHHRGAARRPQGKGPRQTCPGPGERPRSQAGLGDVHRPGDPLPHRPGRAGPGAGRWRRPGVPGAHRRGPGHWQVHPDAADLPAAVPVCQSPLRLRGGVRAAAEAPGRPAGGGADGPVPLCREQPGTGHRRHRGDRAPDRHRGLHPDHVPRGPDHLPREHLPGKGVHHGPDAAGQGPGDHRLCHRPRQQGREPGRPQSPGAHGGLCALLRGGPAYVLPHPPGGEEPLRGHQRDRRL